MSELILMCMGVAALIYIWRWSKQPACYVCGMKTGSAVAFRVRYCLHCGHDPHYDIFEAKP